MLEKNMAQGMSAVREMTEEEKREQHDRESLYVLHQIIVQNAKPGEFRRAVEALKPIAQEMLTRL